MGRRPQWGGRCAPHRAGRPHRRGGILSSVHPGGGEVCAVAGAISPAAFCPHRPGAAGGASLPYTMQCGRRGGAVARIAPGRVQSPRGGLSSASGRRDAVQIGGDFPGGGRHRTAHGKRPGKIAPRKTGNKKEVGAARAVSTSFFASNFRADGITRRRCCCRPRRAAGIRRAPCGRRKRP